MLLLKPLFCLLQKEWWTKTLTMTLHKTSVISKTLQMNFGTKKGHCSLCGSFLSTKLKDSPSLHCVGKDQNILKSLPVADLALFQISGRTTLLVPSYSSGTPSILTCLLLVTVHTTSPSKEEACYYSTVSKIHLTRNTFIPPKAA